MNTKFKIAKNSLAAFITQISFPLSSFIFVFFIAKYLGVSGVGKYSVALSILIIFQAFSCLGFQHLIAKEVAQDKFKAEMFLVNASFIGIWVSIFVAGLMCASIHFISDQKIIINSVYVLSVSLIPYTLGLVCQSINVGFEKLEYITIAMVFGNGLKLLFGLIVLHSGYGLIGLMVVISGSFFISFFISLFLTFKAISKPINQYSKINLNFCKWILKKVPVYALIFVVSTMRMYINIPLLTKMMGEVEVGFFDAAYRLLNICALGIGFYLIAIRPTIFRLYKSSFEKFEFACKESIRYFYIIILPVIASMIILSDKFIILIFKPEFLPAAKVLNILIWLLIFNGFNQILASSLISSDNQIINLKANIYGMILNVALCLLLIPKFSFVGAGIANVSATFITFLYQYSVNKRILFKIQFFHLAKKPIIATFLLTIFILFLKNISLIILIPTSILFYSLLLFFLKVFSTNDIKLFFEFLNLGHKINSRRISM